LRKHLDAMFVLCAGIDAALSQGMKTKGPLPKAFSGMKRFSGILVSLLALSLTVASAAVAAPFAYVSNFGSGTVSVVDSASNTVVATVTVGAMPWGVAVNPKAPRAYVANAGDNSVTVIDTVSNTVVATIPNVGPMPTGIAVSADGTRVYVANADGTIAVIDAGPNTLLAPLVTSGALEGLAVAGSSVYVTDAVSSGVLAVDTTTGIVTPIGLKSTVFGIAADTSVTSGARVYVANGDFDGNLEVSVIDTATNNVVAVTVGTAGSDSGSDPAGIAVSPTGSHVYVTILREDKVKVIDTTNYTVVATVQLPANSRPYGVAVDPTGARVFVGNSDSGGVGSVSVIDTATNTAGAAVAVGVSPLVFGTFVAGEQSSPPPPPPPSSCEDTIKTLQKKVGELKHWQHSQLKIAIRMRAAAQREIELAGAKFGQTHRRVVHAKQEFAQGDKLLCVGRYWRAEHEFSEAYVIARSLLRPHFWR